MLEKPSSTASPFLPSTVRHPSCPGAAVTQLREDGGLMRTET